MTPAGFPHSDIPGSTRICRYPRLFAAYHVLHRLLVPRHPPCALSSLTGHPFGACSLVTRFSYSVVNDPARTSSVRELATRTRRDHRAIPGGARRDSCQRRSAGEPSGPFSSRRRDGGDSGNRTRNLRLAKPALCQLSYIPGREE